MLGSSRILEAQVGIEPTTSALTGRRSTNELLSRVGVLRLDEAYSEAMGFEPKFPTCGSVLPLDEPAVRPGGTRTRVTTWHQSVESNHN